MPTWLPAAQPSCFLCCPVLSLIGEMESPSLRRASILREDNPSQMSTPPTGQTGKKDPAPSVAQRKDRFPGTKKGTCVLGFKVPRGEVKTAAHRQRWRERRKTWGSVNQSWAESKQKRKGQSQVPRTCLFAHLVGDDIREVWKQKNDKIAAGSRGSSQPSQQALVPRTLTETPRKYIMHCFFTVGDPWLRPFLLAAT